MMFVSVLSIQEIADDIERVYYKKRETKQKNVKKKLFKTGKF